jgi:acylphosphatase
VPVYPEDNEIARLVRITGKVQGVWYRGWTCDEAEQRNLRGWVRNRADGSVEALFAGPPKPVAEMIRACEAGPPAAQVAAVRAEVAELPAGPGFLQLPSE